MVKIPNPAGWDAPITLQSGALNCSELLPKPHGLWCRATCPDSLGHMDVGMSLEPQGFPEGPVQALPSLPPTPALQAPPALSCFWLFLPKFPLPRCLQSTWQSDFPSKSCWLCQDGSGRGTKDAPGLSQQPSVAVCWLSQGWSTCRCRWDLLWIHQSISSTSGHSQRAAAPSQPGSAAPASKIHEGPSPTVLFQIKWFLPIVIWEMQEFFPSVFDL